MKLFIIGLGLHLLVLACNAKKDEKAEKELVTVQAGDEKLDDRLKRASTQDELKYRQPTELSPEYLSFLQQFAQRDQAAAAQQPQYIQQYVLPKDGLKQQQPATRYVLSQDGRLIEESLAYLSPQQYASVSAGVPAGVPSGVPSGVPTAYSAFQQQPQAQQVQPQQHQQQPLARPTASPELSEFSRQQQRLQQQYADAPLRAQIAGSAARARQRQQGQPAPAGPTSQPSQVYLQSQSRSDPRLRAPVPTESPNFVYAPVPADAQAILQQQLAQLSIGADADGRQFYVQTPRTVLPQQFIYQQPTQQDFAQLYQQQQQQQQQPPQQQQQPQTFPTRRPVPVTPSPQPQPQTLTQNLPQQYLIETTRPQSQSAQYVPQEVSQQVAQQVQYVQPSQIVPQQSGLGQSKQQFSSTLLQPVSGRSYFDPKPSRSSIFVSKSSTTRPASLDADSQKIPVVRLPSPTDQRPLTRHELEALVNAGFSVSPVPVPVPVPVPIRDPYLKSKRQQPVVLEEGKNHVVYENHQDGVQYQYSPGSPSSKIKKSVTSNGADDVKSPNKALVNENGALLTYILALGNESS